MLKPDIFDCALRDDRYYNNWFFSKSFVSKYIKTINLVNIDYIELGFGFLDKDKVGGPNTHTSDHYTNSIFLL